MAGFLDDADLDRLTQGQNAQLFQLFQLFQRVRRTAGQFQQEGAAVGVQAEVQQEGRRANGEVRLAVTDERDGTAAEVQGAAGGVADDLDAVGVAPLFGAGDGHGEGGHCRGGVGGEAGDEEVEVGRFDERFVALDVDDDVGVEVGGGLGDAVGAAGVVAARQDDTSAEGADGGDDARVVGGHEDVGGAAGLAGAFVDVLHEVLAGLPQQRLAGQATGAVAGGDDDGGAHGGPPCPADGWPD